MSAQVPRTLILWTRRLRRQVSTAQVSWDLQRSSSQSSVVQPSPEFCDAAQRPPHRAYRGIRRHRQITLGLWEAVKSRRSIGSQRCGSACCNSAHGVNWGDLNVQGCDCQIILFTASVRTAPCLCCVSTQNQTGGNRMQAATRMTQTTNYIILMVIMT